MLAKGLLILHDNKTYNLMSPDVGSSYGNLLFPPECPLPGVMKIEGSAWLKLGGGDVGKMWSGLS